MTLSGIAAACAGAPYLSGVEADFSPAALAADVLQAARVYTDEPFVVVGHSMAGGRGVEEVQQAVLDPAS